MSEMQYLVSYFGVKLAKTASEVCGATARESHDIARGICALQYYSSDARIPRKKQ